MQIEELVNAVDELIEVMHLQAVELEKLIAHIGQATGRLPEESEISVIRSSLSGLRHRMKKLRGVATGVTDDIEGLTGK